MSVQHSPNSFRGPNLWPVTIGLTALSVVWTAWLYNTPFSNWLPEAAAPADQIDALFKILAISGGVTFIFTMGFLLYFAIVFRARKGEDHRAIGAQIHDMPKVEIAFWVVPTILVLVISVLSIQIWAGLQSSPGNALTVEAVGHQFFYDFRYPTLWKSVPGEMHLPVGEPITVKASSVDVLHGFWVPEIRLKVDMVPGLINTMRFTPSRIGSYHLICTEFCGVAHGAMVGKVVIESKADFNTWLAGQAKDEGPAPAEAASTSGAPGAATAAGAASGAATGGSAGGGTEIALAGGTSDAGKTVFAAKCATCHQIGPYDQKLVGPGLGNLLHDPAHPKLVTGETASPIAIAHILQKGYSGPIGVMPSQQQNGISDTDIKNLVAYLSSLSTK